MRLPSPLLRGTLIQRYKRFLADVRLDDGRLVTATCPNTGSMMGLAVPGAACGSRKATARRANTATPGSWWRPNSAGPTLVGINTGHPNKLVAEALAQAASRLLPAIPDSAAR